MAKKYIVIYRELRYAPANNGPWLPYSGSVHTEYQDARAEKDGASCIELGHNAYSFAYAVTTVGSRTHGQALRAAERLDTGEDLIIYRPDGSPA